MEEGGFFVTTREGVEAVCVMHARSGHDFGEAEQTWWCMECRGSGKIGEELPDTCLNCGVEKEALMFWTRD